MNRLLTVFLFSLFLISCRENVNVHNALHHVVFDLPSIDIRSISENDMVQMADFVDSVIHIKLETIDESLIGNISQVLFLDSLLIIQDRQTHSVFLFDKNGQFIRTIGRRGQGPGEFATLGRVMLDADNRQIIVFDSALNKVIFYNLDDGAFIREVTQFAGGVMILDIINLPNGNFLCYNFDQNLGHQYSGLWEVDSNGEYIRTLLPPNTGLPFMLNRHGSYFYHLSDGGIGLAAGDVDVIYHFRQDTLTTFLAYHIRNRTTAEDIRHRNRRRNVNNWEVFDHTSKGMTYERGNYIFSEWAADGAPRTISVFSKRDNSIIAIGLPTFRCYRLATFGSNIVPSNDTGSLVVVVDASLVSSYLEHPLMSSELVRNKLLELTYGMSEREIEDMNPIIQILHIRQ